MRAIHMLIVLVCSLAVGAAIALLTARPPAAETRPPGPPRIVVSIPPLAWPARALAPEDTELTMLIEPGGSAHAAELPPSRLAALDTADLVVLIGLGMEPVAESRLAAADPAWRRVVRMGELPSVRAVVEERAAARSDGRIDAHLWLDPILVGELVAALREALAELGQPVAAEVFDAAMAETVAIDAAYRAATADLRARTLVTHHAAYGHLAARYDLETAALHRFDELEPTPAELEAVRTLVRERGVGTVFVEPQLDRRTVDWLVERTDVRVLQLDPLGSGDWPAMMRRNLAAIVEGLGGAEP